MTFHEEADGRLLIYHGGRVLSYRAFAKDDAQIMQGAIVENKHLGAALGRIADRQRARDAQSLPNPKSVLRTKARIRAAAALTA